MEVDNFGVIPARHNDFGLSRDIWVRPSNRGFNKQSLCARKLAAPRAERDF